jgi:hypothetical protein
VLPRRRSQHRGGRAPVPLLPGRVAATGRRPSVGPPRSFRRRITDVVPMTVALVGRAWLPVTGAILSSTHLGGPLCGEHWPPTDAAEPPRSTTSNPPLFPRQADGGHNCFLFFVVLIRGTKRGLTVLIRGNILITSAPPSRLGIDAVALGDLRRFPRLVAVLSPLELGRGDAVPCPLLRQWRAGHRHGPAPSLQKQQVSCKKGGNKTGRYLTGQ